MIERLQSVIPADWSATPDIELGVRVELPSNRRLYPASRSKLATFEAHLRQLGRPALRGRVVLQRRIALRKVDDVDLLPDISLVYLGRSDDFTTELGWLDGPSVVGAADLAGAYGLRIVGQSIMVACVLDQSYRLVTLDRELRVMAVMPTPEILAMCELDGGLLVALRGTVDGPPELRWVAPGDTVLQGHSQELGDGLDQPIRALAPGPDVAWAWPEAAPDEMYAVGADTRLVRLHASVPSVLWFADEIASTGSAFLVSVIPNECWAWRPDTGDLRRYVLDDMHADVAARPTPDGLVVTVGGRDVSVHHLEETR